MRSQAYDVPPLPAGTHELRIVMIDPGSNAPLTVDLLTHDEEGNAIAMMSGAEWIVRRDDGPAKRVQLYSKQEHDAAAWHLHRRPHPLPGAAWLEGPQPDVVLDLPTCPVVTEPVTQWFEWTIPPGARSMRVPLAPDVHAEISVEGTEYAMSSDGSVDLGSTPAPARHATLRVVSRHLGGGVFTSPVTYQFGPGVFATGSWLSQGLRSYSGAVQLTQRFAFDQAPPPRNAVLDLGHVRGSVEARLNGELLGQRFISPYRFELGQSLRAGENELQLIITNTLANYLSTWSPTRGWSPDQLEAGVFGPVAIQF
jgi:hypothetical protein